MARDPRWGRTAETYGEDLTLPLVLQLLLLGFTGNNPAYIKVVACPSTSANNEEDNG